MAARTGAALLWRTPTQLDLPVVVTVRASSRAEAEGIAMEVARRAASALISAW